MAFPADARVNDAYKLVNALFQGQLVQTVDLMPAAAGTFLSLAFSLSSVWPDYIRGVSQAIVSAH